MNILIMEFSKWVVLLDLQMEVTMSTPGVFEVVHICGNPKCFHYNRKWTWEFTCFLLHCTDFTGAGTESSKKNHRGITFTTYGIFVSFCMFQLYWWTWKCVCPYDYPESRHKDSMTIAGSVSMFVIWELKILHPYLLTRSCANIFNFLAMF